LGLPPAYQQFSARLVAHAQVVVGQPVPPKVEPLLAVLGHGQAGFMDEVATGYAVFVLALLLVVGCMVW
jgi:hypothetical protein